MQPMPPITRRLVALALAGALAASTAGCSHSPGVSNGSVSACFRAIPVGRSALHDGQAKLIGVHRVPVDKVRNHLPRAIQENMAAEDDTAVCAMAFEGSFGAGQVDLASPDEAGRYALVLVSSRKLQLLASFVLTQLPKAFGGRTI
jgi:hypothetical protein